MDHKYGAIILAAGASSRLGSPKQLVQFKGKNLLQHIMDEVNACEHFQTVVVLGAQKDLIIREIILGDATIVFNDQWEQGMSTSIIDGLLDLKSKNSDIAGVLLLVCDQPFVTSDLLRSILNAFISNDKGLAACKYGDIIGTPAMLGSMYFDSLLALTGDRGAGKLLREHITNACIIPFEEGLRDIDTISDLGFLQEK